MPRSGPALGGRVCILGRGGVGGLHFFFFFLPNPMSSVPPKHFSSCVGVAKLERRLRNTCDVQYFGSSSEFLAG